VCAKKFLDAGGLLIEVLGDKVKVELQLHARVNPLLNTTLMKQLQRIMERRPRRRRAR